jgi:hypothetical protein
VVVLATLTHEAAANHRHSKQATRSVIPFGLPNLVGTEMQGRSYTIDAEYLLARVEVVEVLAVLLEELQDVQVVVVVGLQNKTATHTTTQAVTAAAA